MLLTSLSPTLQRLSKCCSYCNCNGRAEGFCRPQAEVCSATDCAVRCCSLGNLDVLGDQASGNRLNVSPYQFAAVGIRLFAIWLSMYVGRIAPSFFAEVEQYDSRVAVAGGAIVAVGTVVTIVILWFFPRSIAKTLVPDSRSVANDPAPPDMWFAIGCGLIGIWLYRERAIPGLQCASPMNGFMRGARTWKLIIRVLRSFITLRTSSSDFGCYSGPRERESSFGGRVVAMNADLHFRTRPLFR